MRQTTLCYLEQDDCYLMLHRNKKKQDVNENKWIGVGGKFLPGEAPEECLIREVYEETGLTLLDYQFRGVLTFCCDVQEPEYIFLYTSSRFTGTLKPCDEGELAWIPKNKVLDLSLWEGDKLMFRLMDSSNQPFSLKLVYQGDTLIEAKEFPPPKTTTTV